MAIDREGVVVLIEERHPGDGLFCLKCTCNNSMALWVRGFYIPGASDLRFKRLQRSIYQTTLNPEVCILIS